MRLHGYFWTENGWEQTSHDVPEVNELQAQKLAGACWFIPGLVDAHAHLAITANGTASRAAAVAQTWQQLRAGVTVVREPGSPLDTGFLDEYAWTPWIVRSGQHLARPKRYLRGYAKELAHVTDLPAQMQAEARPGQWVKLVADWIDRDAGVAADLDPLWCESELREGIAAAHAVGARVTAHAFGTKAIPALLAAGIDCIEHGSGMPQEFIDEAACRQIPVTPTLLQTELFGGFANQAGQKYPRYAATMSALSQQREEHFVALINAGVQLLPGTDAGGYQRHGKISEELLLWRKYGMADDAILTAAIYPARAYLGAPTVDWGRELVAFAADPSRDISVLAHPQLVLNRGLWIDPDCVEPPTGDDLDSQDDPRMTSVERDPSQCRGESP